MIQPPSFIGISSGRNWKYTRRKTSEGGTGGQCICIREVGVLQFNWFIQRSQGEDDGRNGVNLLSIGPLGGDHTYP